LPLGKIEMNVAGYVRCSTEDQHRSGLGLQDQRQIIEAACVAKGWTLVHIYEDVMTGSRMDRPDLEAALAAIDGGLDGLVCAKLDRLGRSVHGVSELIERFAKHDKALVCLDIGMDTSTIMGAAMAQMAAVFGEMERRRIGERIKGALRAKPGYAYDEETRKRARELKASGLTLERIAIRLEREGVVPLRGGSQLSRSAVAKMCAA
jgi:DNA invertase Pin-like site-specific DNA recombinase